MPAYASLRRTADFARLRQRGRRIASHSLTIFRTESFAGDRLAVAGITVGKPVGKAVVRNRVRRRVAAILRESLAGRRLRVLVIVRPPAADAAFSELRRDIRRALE